MIRLKAPGKSKPPKPEWIGFLPGSAPFHRRVHGCFVEAGFVSIRVGINADFSLTTFWLEQGTHPPFRSRKQARATLFRLLRTGGVDFEAETLVVALDGNSICGAFMPLHRDHAAPALP